MMSTLRIQNVYVVSNDVGGSRKFYEDALGLNCQFQDHERWAQFKIGTGNFSISSQDEAGDGITGFVPVFEVEDIDSIGEQVQSAGGQIGPVRDMGGHGHTAVATDPNGNRFQLFCRQRAQV